MRIVSLPAWGLLVGVLFHGGLWAAPPAGEVRIASPWPAQNAIIAMLGYGDNIVGTSNVANRSRCFAKACRALTLSRR